MPSSSVLVAATYAATRLRRTEWEAERNLGLRRFAAAVGVELVSFCEYAWAAGFRSGAAPACPSPAPECNFAAIGGGNMPQIPEKPVFRVHITHPNPGGVGACWERWCCSFGKQATLAIKHHQWSRYAQET